MWCVMIVVSPKCFFCEIKVYENSKLQYHRIQPRNEWGSSSLEDKTLSMCFAYVNYLGNGLDKESVSGNCRHLLLELYFTHTPAQLHLHGIHLFSLAAYILWAMDSHGPIFQSNSVWDLQSAEIQPNSRGSSFTFISKVVKQRTQLHS